jgi:putative RecB family exonuclease
MQKKVQSPSSINCYKHCPRKYFYTYILGLETPSNVHQIRGHVAHSALEHFFDIDTSNVSIDTYEPHLKLIMQDLLLKEWKNAQKEFSRINLPKEQEMFYFEETILMLFNWLNQFSERISEKQGTFQERFKSLTPEREKMYVSQELFAKGIIDAIENDGNGNIRLMDYKTSKDEDVNAHLLQLAIYSLLYYKEHGVMPKKAGIYFLKGKEQVLDVDEKLLEMAKKEILWMHENTKSSDVKDYPKCTGPLCRWSTGKCEFFDVCKPF